MERINQFLGSMIRRPLDAKMGDEPSWANGNDEQLEFAVIDSLGFHLSGPPAFDGSPR